MLTLEQMRAALEDRNIKEVSRRTGINYVVLDRLVRGGRTEDGRPLPRGGGINAENAEKLSAYILESCSKIPK